MSISPREKWLVVSNFSKRLIRRIGAFGAGYAGKAGLDFVFDNVMYPAVLVWFGVLFGEVWGATATLVLMAPLSIPFNLFEIWVYDKTRVDWFSFEKIKSFKGDESMWKWQRFIAKTLRRSDIISFFVLSIKEDPTMTMLYMRHGAYAYNGLSRRDWKIFLLSTLIANAYWTVRWSAIIVLFKLFFQHI